MRKIIEVESSICPTLYFQLLLFSSRRKEEGGIKCYYTSDENVTDFLSYGMHSALVGRLDHWTHSKLDARGIFDTMQNQLLNNY